MEKKIVVDKIRGKTRVAVIEDGRVAEIYNEDEQHQRLIGSVYRGKVQNVLKGMNVAFVDIGHEKNAFLYAGDINTDPEPFSFTGEDNPTTNYTKKNLHIGDHIKIGQEITVQIMKEAIGTKGARVSTNITLPGKYAVLLPMMNYIGVSHKINSEAERMRLREVAKKVCPSGLGLIMRTQAQGKTEDDVTDDIQYLMEQWEHIKQSEKKGKVPRLLYKDESLLNYVVRDLFSADVSELLVNSDETYKLVYDICSSVSPMQLKNIKRYGNENMSFMKYDIEAAISGAVRRKVWLENGGYIIIDNTEALTAIDVNTGRYVGKDDINETILNTNLQAAEIIAQQLRLRDIGGIVIIDFIDMKSDENKHKVIEALKNACKNDRSSVTVVGMTHLGLVELTRKKDKKRLSSVLLNPCPYCNGTGRVFSESVILEAIEKELKQQVDLHKHWGFAVEAHPSVVKDWVDEDCKILYILSNELQVNLVVAADENMHVENYNIIPIDSQSEYDLYITHTKDRLYVTPVIN